MLEYFPTVLKCHLIRYEMHLSLLLAHIIYFRIATALTFKLCMRSTQDACHVHTESLEIRDEPKVDRTLGSLEYTRHLQPVLIHPHLTLMEFALGLLVIFLSLETDESIEISHRPL